MGRLSLLEVGRSACLVFYFTLMGGVAVERCLAYVLLENYQNRSFRGFFVFIVVLGLVLAAAVHCLVVEG